MVPEGLCNNLLNVCEFHHGRVSLVAYDQYQGINPAAASEGKVVLYVKYISYGLVPGLIQ